MSLQISSGDEDVSSGRSDGFDLRAGQDTNDDDLLHGDVVTGVAHCGLADGVLVFVRVVAVDADVAGDEDDVPSED